jgi:prepilin peptidase CpaA
MLTYFLIAAVLVAAVAAWTDSRTGTIPNWLTFGALGVGLAAHLVLAIAFSHSWHEGVRNVGVALFGAILCAAAPVFLFAKGAIGGGDVKPFAALGALCLPLVGMEVEMYGFVAAAVLALGKLAYDGRLLRTLAGSLALLVNPFRSAEKRRAPPAEVTTWFRLGPAILLGAAATLIVHWGEL